MNIKCFLIIGVCLFFASCGENKKDKDSSIQHIQELKKYLKDKNLHKTKGFQVYVLLQPEFCGSCTRQIQEFVKHQLVTCNNSHKTLILSSDNENVVKLFSGVELLEIIIEEESHLQKYDLANGLELFLSENEGQEVKSGIINLEEIEAGLSFCKDTTPRL